MKTRSIHIILLLLLISNLFLAGCSVSSPKPDEVMSRFARALASLESFHYQINLKTDGEIPLNLVGGVLSADVRLSGSVDSQDPSTPRFTLEAQVAANSSNGRVDVAGQLINLDDYTYFKLTKLTLPSLSPISLGADSRWYRIRHPDTGADTNKLGADPTSQLTPEQITDLKEVVAASPLFTVTEVYPDETASGQRSYHYQASLNSDSLQQVTASLEGLAQAARITAGSLDWLVDYNFELWISKRSFQLTRLKVNGTYTSNEVSVPFELDLSLTRHNDTLPISAPTASEEINSPNAPFFSNLGV